MSDMLRSIFVIGVLILALAGLGWWFQVRPETKVKAVDYMAAAKSASGVAGFPVLAPDSLPKGWKATTVRYDAGKPGEWHLGVLTEKEAYIGLEETPLSADQAVEEFAPGTKPTGTSHAGGFTWQLRKSARGETTLVRREGKMTILVTGTAKRPVIEDYAASLRAQ